MLWQLNLFGRGGLDPTTLGVSGVADLIGRIISFAFILAGSVGVVILVWAGIQYILAGGNESTQTVARKTIAYSIVGLVVIALAFIAVHFLLQLIGFQPSTLTNYPGSSSPIPLPSQIENNVVQ